MTSVVNGVVLFLVEERTGCSIVCVWSVVKSYYRTIGKEYMLEHTLLVCECQQNRVERSWDSLLQHSSEHEASRSFFAEPFLGLHGILTCS